MNEQKKKTLSLIESLAKFTPDDGRQWNEWEPSNPLFEKFYILGPKSFDKNDNEISILYEYPEKCAEGLVIQDFLFIENIEIPDISFKDSLHKESYVCTANNIYDKAIFFKNVTGTPVYTYCLKFVASPLTRPSELVNDNVFIELDKYRNSETIPQALFALCIESIHPFYKFYFMILERILQNEAKSRISAQNIYFKNYSCDNIQHTMLWPNSSYFIRESFLNQLLQSFLPCYNEKLTIYSNGFPDFTFQMPSIEDSSFSIALWSYKPLLRWMKIEDFLCLISSLLLEKTIFVVGSKAEEIIKTTAFLPQLISPFLWVCPLISILPPNLEDILDVPMSSIIGLLSRLKNRIPTESFIIDLDERKFIKPESILKLPFHNELKAELKQNSYIFKGRKDSLSKKSALELLKIIKKFIKEKLAEPVLKSIMTNLRTDGSEGSMFISKIYFDFFNDKYDKYQSFIQILLETTLFNAFKEQNCRNKTRLSSSQNFEIFSYNQWYLKFCPLDNDETENKETKNKK